MKSKIVYGVLSIVVTLLAISLLTRKEIPTLLVSNKQIISIYHTDQSEEIKLSLLTTNPNNFYFDQDYVTFSKLYNEDQTVSMKIHSIVVSNDDYEYNNQTFYRVDYFFKLPFAGTNTYINMDEVFLSMDYDNGDCIDIYIGEFNYLFREYNDDDISLGNLSATYEYIDNIETVGGVNVTLSNLTSDNLNITNISIVSTSVKANYNKTLERSECSYQETVADCILEEGYDFNNHKDSDKTFLVRKNNNIELYIPLNYLYKTQYLYRFSIIIEYEIDGVVKEYIIDDFPFMSKGIYLKEMEGRYYDGTIIHSSN